jgi:hypothetical protein
MASSATSTIQSGYHITAPGAPTTVFSGTGGLLGNGNYQYVVTFVTPNGETTQGTASVAASPGTATGSCALSAIPLGSAFVTSRKIYRTTVGGALTTLGLVTTLANNTATTYTDGAADGSLGAAPPANSSADSVTSLSGTVNIGGLVQTATANGSAAVAGTITANGSYGQWTVTGLTQAGGATGVVTIKNTAITTASIIRVSLNSYSTTLSTNGIPLPSVTAIIAGQCTLNISNAHSTNALSGTAIIGYSIAN